MQHERSSISLHLPHWPYLSSQEMKELFKIQPRRLRERSKHDEAAFS
jgi:hypothetical protein